MTRTDLPSVLQPWDPAPFRALTGFARQVIAERARLAMIDPEGEAAARAPLTPVRARWILLVLAEQDAERAAEAARRRAAAPARPDWRPDGRELLDRIGVDPNRGRGVVKCPAHEDRSPSLSWRLADDGRALLHCFSGCTFPEILAAVA